ncbi:tetratricopeptide repeat protein [Bradyrhizobium oropedii]|uniref:tetratricopeptide repeat protein n=1 Tax=Bradyrhizobium oropedii TaxID=1571201 RepID=UPI003084067A
MIKQDNAEDIVRRATTAFNAGRHGEAIELCEHGLARQPGEPMLSHLLAAVLFAKGEIAPARKHVETSLARRPDNAAARLLAARLARSGGEFDAALTHLDRVIALKPHRDAFVEKARTLELAGRKAQAREAWEAIRKAVPEHQEASARLGRMAWEDGDLAGAARLLERATASAAPASVWFDLGVARQDLRDHDGAACAYRKAIEIRPDYAEAALNLGIVLQESGEPDAAMQAFARAYALRPQLFGSIAMALTSAPHGRLWLDERALRAALEHDPEKSEAVFRNDHAPTKG